MVQSPKRLGVAAGEIGAPPGLGLGFTGAIQVMLPNPLCSGLLTVASSPRSGAWLSRSSPKPSISIAGFTERLINGTVPPLVCLVNCRLVSNKRTGVLLWRRISAKNSQTGLSEHWKIMWLIQARFLQSFPELTPTCIGLPRCFAGRRTSLGPIPFP